MRVRPSRETIGERSRTHGMRGTRFYTCYFSIIQRCNDKKSTNYPKYGGKGIRNLWKSFEEFRDDMYEPYLEHVKEYGERQTTIDRINPLGNYCRENCRWATMLEQARNKTNNVSLTYEGKTQSVLDWAKEIGIPHSTITTRLHRNWPIENVLSAKKFHRYRSGKIL